MSSGFTAVSSFRLNPAIDASNQSVLNQLLRRAVSGLGEILFLAHLHERRDETRGLRGVPEGVKRAFRGQDYSGSQMGTV